MSYLDIKYKWIPTGDVAATELTATLARLQFFLGKHNITEHRPPAGANELQIPVFYLAEWILENWWVLLFEPRKHEEEEDPEFLSRHSILAAQHGFPLPALSIVPFGRSIGLSCSPRRAPFANVHFTVDAFGGASREEVQEILAKFLEDTVLRLETQGLKDTLLAQMWREMRSLSEDEKKFCELVGSLGVSPAETSDALTDAVEKIYNTFGERAVRDFCLAATEIQAIRAANSGDELAAALRSSPTSELSSLFGIRLPPDNYNAPSWRRGMQAAKNVREKFHVNPKDRSGADKIFEALRIDTSKVAHLRESTICLFSPGQ